MAHLMLALLLSAQGLSIAKGKTPTTIPSVALCELELQLVVLES